MFERGFGRFPIDGFGLEARIGRHTIGWVRLVVTRGYGLL